MSHDRENEGNKAVERSGDKAKAHDVMRHDVPDYATKREAERPSDDRDKVYRPDENVDNEKSPEGQVSPGHNSSIEQTPYSGVQVKDKPQQKKNINEKSDEADSPRRNG